MTPMPEEKTFNAKAANLNYLEWGPSLADPLVLLHGGAWSWQEYLSLIPSLAKKWHVYEVKGSDTVFLLYLLCKIPSLTPLFHIL